ncbi:MAG: oligoendopeptidase F [Pseudomonadota bacterium]
MKKYGQKRLSLSIILAFFTFTLTAYGDKFMPDANLSRDQIPDQYKWDKAHVFKNVKEWENELEDIKDDLKKIDKCKGKLEEDLYDCFALIWDLKRRVEKVSQYAMFTFDEDQSISKSKEMYDKANSLENDYHQAASFVDPEILAINEDKLRKAIKEEKMKPYRFGIESILRQKNHVRSKEVEEVRALYGKLSKNRRDIFDAIFSEVKFPKIKDEDGKEVELTLSNYSKYRGSKKREVRAETSEKFFETLAKHKRMLAQAYNDRVVAHVVEAKSSNYDTSLGMCLDRNDITPDFYKAFIQKVKKNLKRTIHKYVKMRAEYMGLKKLRFYDLYNPLFPSAEIEMTYEEARKEILASLKPMGAEYLKDVDIGMNPANGWVDIYPSKNKDSGAYHDGVYDVHSFVKLNYMDTLDDAFTMAHEFGHAMHSVYANRAQPYSTSNYTTFLAEIASIFQEMMLQKYLMDKAIAEKDEQKKIYLLTNFIDNMRTTVFRQTLFAEFEMLAHEEYEKGNPLTADRLEKIYGDLVAEYYGPYFERMPNDGLEWSYVPHFYYNFYVFQYATSMILAASFSESVLNGNDKELQNYLSVLKAGGSDYPMDILKTAGFDVKDCSFVDPAMDLLEKNLEELEGYLNKTKK